MKKNENVSVVNPFGALHCHMASDQSNSKIREIYLIISF